MINSTSDPSPARIRRVACDRCHELKNRCTKEEGPHTECDRCRRLGIDCVFSPPSRMGRPRGQRSLSCRQAGPKPAEPSRGKRKVRLRFGDRTCPKASCSQGPDDHRLRTPHAGGEKPDPICPDNDYQNILGGGMGNAISSADLGLGLISAGWPESREALDRDVDLVLPDLDLQVTDFMSQLPYCEYDLPLATHWSPPKVPAAVPAAVLASSSSSSSSSGAENKDRCGDGTEGVSPLSQLQQKLQSLTASSVMMRWEERTGDLPPDTRSSPGDHHVLPEALSASEAWIATVDELRRQSYSIETEKTRAALLPAAALQGGGGGGGGEFTLPPGDGDSRADAAPVLLLLQVALCYIHLLHVYGDLLRSLVADMRRLETEAGQRELMQLSPSSSLRETVITIGPFHLASHFDLKAPVAFQLISSMLKRMQKSFETFVVGISFADDDDEEEEEEEEEGNDSRGERGGSSRCKHAPPDLGRVSARGIDPSQGVTPLSQTCDPVFLATKSTIQVLRHEEAEIFAKLDEGKRYL